MVNMFENRELEILFDEFLDGLISTVSDYSYEPTETIPVGLMRDEDKRKYMPDVDEIVKKQYVSVKKYCDEYFLRLTEESDSILKKSLDDAKVEIESLLNRLKILGCWDTNEYHVENKIYEDKIEFTEGTTEQWFPVYKKIADHLTKSIFEEDKRHIAELWKNVIDKIQL